VRQADGREPGRGAPACTEAARGRLLEPAGGHEQPETVLRFVAHGRPLRWRTGWPATAVAACTPASRSRPREGARHAVAHFEQPAFDPPSSRTGRGTRTPARSVRQVRRASKSRRAVSASSRRLLDRLSGLQVNPVGDRRCAAPDRGHPPTRTTRSPSASRTAATSDSTCRSSLLGARSGGRLRARSTRRAAVVGSEAMCPHARHRAPRVRQCRLVGRSAARRPRARTPRHARRCAVRTGRCAGWRRLHAGHPLERPRLGRWAIPGNTTAAIGPHARLRRPAGARTAPGQPDAARYGSAPRRQRPIAPTRRDSR